LGQQGRQQQNHRPANCRRKSVGERVRSGSVITFSGLGASCGGAVGAGFWRGRSAGVLAAEPDPVGEQDSRGGDAAAAAREADVQAAAAQTRESRPQIQGRSAQEGASGVEDEDAGHL
ncbi:hypothetical protein IWW52_007039, partial [Coemansia sp. RSA 2704]